MAASLLVSTLFLFITSISFSEGREYLVGGKTDAWKVPSSQSDSLNKWAQNSRFLVGDSLVWKYESDKDSVLQVTKGDYVSCNTTSPIEEYKDGNTKVTLHQSGPYYFISGASGNCEKGQKLIVVVISATHRSFFAAISPAPSPADFNGPAIAPAPTSSAATLQASLMVVLVGWFVLMRAFGF